MSLVFVVGSEEQLSRGAAWCRQLAEVADGEIHVVVVGTDRKTLAQYAKRKWPDQVEVPADRLTVHRVASEAEAVLACAQSVGCQTLLMVHRTDDHDLQRQLFEESMFLTMWLLAKGPPPTSSDQLLAVFRPPSLATTIASERLFGFPPASTLCRNVDLDDEDLNAAMITAIDGGRLQPSDVVVCGIEDTLPSDPVYQAGLSLLESTIDATIALVHTGDSLAETIVSKLDHWAASVAPPMEREQRIELAQDLQTGSKPNLEFLGLISASSMLAAFGLLQDSAAVIIGAMLIAPLMTPIIGAGLALAQGNQPLFRSALWTIALGFIGGLVASTLFGCLVLVFQEQAVTGEMWARCRPSPLDFCVGMVGGIAASYARTRRHLSSALAGAAIAAALVPPISTAGLQIAFRAWAWEETNKGVPIVGPLLLVAVNVLMIMIGSSFVLWARGMRTDRTIPIKDRWTLRMFAMLLVLALLILIWVLHPFPET